jgi:hypothetical protein
MVLFLEDLNLINKKRGDTGMTEASIYKLSLED